MNFIGTRNDVTNALKSIGQICKISHASGGTSSCYGVFGKIIASDLEPGAASMVTISNRELYISYTSKEPKCGDLIKIGKNEYGINDVETYAPSDIVIAYLLRIDN